MCLGMAILSMTGCEPEAPSDSTPPDHIIKLPKSQGKYRYGVTDTINVDFSEKIDTARITAAFDPVQSIGSRLVGLNRLQIFGTQTTSGKQHFNINSGFKATVSGVKDLNGNGGPQFEESFQPYAWTDRDFVDAGFTGYDSLFSSDTTLWIDGTPLTDSLVAEGRLDFSNNFGQEDRQDYKIIRLVPPDTLKLVVSCSKGLNLRTQIAGPFSPVGLDTALANYKFANSFFSDSTKAKGTLSYSFNADFSRHYDMLGSPAEPGIYVIRLSIPADTEGFYRLGLRLIKRKKV